MAVSRLIAPEYAYPSGSFQKRQNAGSAIQSKGRLQWSGRVSLFCADCGTPLFSGNEKNAEWISI